MLAEKYGNRGKLLKKKTLRQLIIRMHKKSEKSKSFVLMLPTDNSIVNSRALLNKINSTFSLRKKRASHKNGVNKSSKAIKIMKK